MHNFLVLFLVILLAFIVSTTAYRMFAKCNCKSRENFVVTYPHAPEVELNELDYSTNDENMTGDYSSVAPNRDVWRWYQPEMGNMGDSITSGYVYYKAL